MQNQDLRKIRQAFQEDSPVQVVRGKSRRTAVVQQLQLKSITMIDSHCHIEHMKDAESVLDEAKNKGMKAVVTSSLNVEEAEAAFALQRKYPDFLHVCIGLHPSEIDNFQNISDSGNSKASREDFEKFPQLEDYIDYIMSKKEKLVAIGEVGLDYTWLKDEEKREKSRQIFIQLIELSRELRLPLVIHSREAMRDTLDILKAQGAKDVMLHCFSGNEATLEIALELGYYISFATNICWTKKHPYLAARTPIDRLLLETDAPWLDPDSTADELKDKNRELKNRPWKIEKSAAKIAEIKGLTKEEVLRITAENAARFFRL